MGRDSYNRKDPHSRVGSHVTDASCVAEDMSKGLERCTTLDFTTRRLRSESAGPSEKLRSIGLKSFASRQRVRSDKVKSYECIPEQFS